MNNKCVCKLNEAQLARDFATFVYILELYVIQE